jgi:glyoxylase-like metal-dependent hydrolase (beta-lactamase superfamily II)
MYLVVGRERAALVDSGMGVGDVRIEIAKITSLPCIVLNTHHHWDHVGANALFDASAIHENESDQLAQEQSIGAFREAFRSPGARSVLPLSFDPDSYRIIPRPATHILHDGDEIDLGDRVLTALHTPGHSPGHCTYLDEEDGLLFTGDTAYVGPVFACFDGSDPAAFAKSASRLAGLPGSWTVCPGHNDLVTDPGWLNEFAKCVEVAVSGRVEGTWRDDLFVGREFRFGALSVWLPA